MIHKIFNFLLLFTITVNCFSQKKIYIKDSINGKVLEYVTIKYLNNNRGTYSNEEGFFIADSKEIDSILVSYLGYHTKKIKLNDVGNEILLLPKIEVLEEIIIKNTKFKNKTIGYIKKRKTLFWEISPQTELITLIQFENKYKNSYLKKVFIPIGKEAIQKISENELRGYFPKFKSVFRLHLYSNNKNYPDKRLLKKPILIECNESSEEIIVVDIENEFIIYPNEGVFIGIEMIETTNDFANLPTFQFTNEVINKIESKSYIKSAFDFLNWTSTEDFSKNSKIKSLSNYNMAISLELSIYE